ncbi:hypothetical protein DQ04_05341010 [Trypanosoma grayi]|uniref:hypothetical protein n=1 Tax=Trypanosoma grayi TaxID=71804 RepID=UPI0004F4050B|nr:hypothetical protein DQ04_05341010 [Trypanosoma grayi]KEG09365.1 hypothetical protein DQ04_05341010 [Trypanosoma grayi]
MMSGEAGSSTAFGKTRCRIIKPSHPYIHTQREAGTCTTLHLLTHTPEAPGADHASSRIHHATVEDLYAVVMRRHRRRLLLSIFFVSSLSSSFDSDDDNDDDGKKWECGT